MNGIVRITIDLPNSVTRKYQLGHQDKTAPDTTFKHKLMSPSPIEVCGNLGHGWEESSFNFTLDDNDAEIRGNEAIWYGRPVTAIVYDEVNVSGSWQLVERVQFAGAVSQCQTSRRGQVLIQCAERHSLFGLVIPAKKIDSATYPAARPAALGKYRQIVTGTHYLPTGALVAWNVGGGRYFAAENTLHSVTGIFSGDVSIPTNYWQLVIGDDGVSYISYTPPQGVEGIPENETDFLAFNCVATAADNPVTALKLVLDTALGANVLFDGDSALQTTLGNRGYKAAMCLSMGDTVGDVLTQFCDDFDVIGHKGSDGKIRLRVIDPTPVATLSTNILSVTDSETPGEMGNHVTFAWGYDFAGNKFGYEDVYSHPESVEDYGQREALFEFFFTRDEATARDVTRRKVRQIREVVREAVVTVPYADQVSINVGDVITINSASMLRTGAQTWIVKRKSISWQGGKATLTCRTYFSGMDYFVKVMRNYEGGSVSPLGLVVLSGGANLTITASPYQYQEINYFWIDFTTKVTGQSSYTITGIAKDYEIVVAFKTARFLIQAADDGNGTISPKGAVYVEAGANQSFDYTPNSGKKFDHFMVDGVKTTTKPYTFSNVTGTHTITAYSTAIPVEYITLTISRTGTGTISPRPAGTYQIAKGSSVWMTFSPNASSVHVNGSLFATNTNGVSLGQLLFNTIVEAVF